MNLEPVSILKETENTTKDGISIREQKIKLKKMIYKQKKESEQDKVDDYYREKPMNMSHIQLRKGVETEEKISQKGFIDLKT